MLNKCPECDLPVSDLAKTCPHCGYPINTVQRRVRTKPHMRLPNGFGQISEIKGKKLRNPWRAMITVGKTSTGRPICKILKPQGYFASYNDAYAALVEYNRNPYDLDKDITVQELYDRWFQEYQSNGRAGGSIRSAISTWAYCAPIQNMPVREVRIRHLKACLYDSKILVNGKYHSPTPSVQTRIKSLLNMVFDYAVEYELVEKNYARSFSVEENIKKEAQEAKRSHIVFTKEEMRKLWDNVNIIPYADVVLIQCFTGWRPQELGLLKLENINLKDWTMTGGIKTPAGLNRTIPIHSAIQPLIKKLYENAKVAGSEYLIRSQNLNHYNPNDFLTYDRYNVRFTNVVKALELNPEHRPHDPRKQFVTMAKEYNVNDFAIKRIIGHKIDDITEKIYTERNMDWLRSEIEKIKAL